MSTTPPPPPQESTWYYLAGQQRLGPIPTQTIVSLIEGGTITAGTLVWRQGMETWAPIGGVPEFAFAFSSACAGSPLSAASINAAMTSRKEAALGLTTGGLVLFIVLLVVCWPLCWLPWVINDFKAGR